MVNFKNAPVTGAEVRTWPRVQIRGLELQSTENSSSLVADGIKY
jgi:hypothetical protein